MELDKERTVVQGARIYERDIRAQVEPENDGRFIAIDVPSGDYEIADEMLESIDCLRSRHPNTVPYIHRIGHPAAFTLGTRFVPRP